MLSTDFVNINKETVSIVATDYISLATGTKTSYKLPAPNNMESSSILKHLKVAKEVKSLKCAKVFKEVFQRHF